MSKFQKIQIVALTAAVVGSMSFGKISAQDVKQDMVNALYRLAASVDRLANGGPEDSWLATLHTVRGHILKIKKIDYRDTQSFFADDERAVNRLIASAAEIGYAGVEPVVQGLKAHLKEAFEHVLAPDPEPRFSRGDIDHDGRTDLTDVINLLGFLFTGGNEPGCMKAADANDDGALNIGDPVSLLSSLFLDAGSPPAPWGACGTDPTPDSLTCDNYTSCPPVAAK